MIDQAESGREGIDLDTVRHIASLARLRFTADEEIRLASELERIVGFVAVLEQLDLPAEDPVLAVPTPLRADRATNLSRAEDMLAGAPDRQEHHILVPAVMKDKG